MFRIFSLVFDSRIVAFYIFRGLTFAAAKFRRFTFFCVCLNLRDQQKFTKHRPRWYFFPELITHKYFEINVFMEFTAASLLFIYAFFVVRQHHEQIKA